MTAVSSTLLDVEAVATLLRIKSCTVRRLANDRQLVPVRVGRLLRFDPADVQKFIDSAKAPSAPGGPLTS
jgi:excisionase family DNA binding protein